MELIPGMESMYSLETEFFIDDAIALEGAHNIKKTIGKGEFKELQKAAENNIASLNVAMAATSQVYREINQYAFSVSNGKYDKKRITQKDIEAKYEQVTKLNKECVKTFNEFNELVKKHSVDDKDLKSLYKQSLVDYCGMMYSITEDYGKSISRIIKQLHVSNKRYKISPEEVQQLSKIIEYANDKIFAMTFTNMKVIFRRSHLVAYVQDNSLSAGTIMFGAYYRKPITFG